MQMVIQRELRAAARDRGSYWARVLAGGFATLALLMNTGSVPSGRRLFFTAVTLALVACIFEGVRRSAASIAKEKTEGTLELLFITALTGPELLRGKFAAIAISAFQAAFAAVPILAASLLLGGVSAGEFLRALLALAHASTLVIALGLRTSTRAKDSDAAMLGTFAWIALSAGLLVGLGLSFPLLRPINPMGPVVSISDAEYARAPWAFWVSLLLWQAFVWFSLKTLGERLAEHVKAQQEQEFRTAPPVRIEDWRYKPGEVMPVRVQDAPRWFNENPIDWFTVRHMGMHDGRWGALFISIFLACFGLLSPEMGAIFSMIGIGILTICLCVTSARSMARLKESGLLELALTTSLTDREILAGHREGLKRVFLWPFAIWILVLASAWLRSEDVAAFIVSYMAIGACLMAWMTPWFAVASALKTKSPQRAIGWTVFSVLLIPRLFFCWMGDAIYFGIAGLFVRNYVLKNFRRLVAERFTT